MNSKKAIAIALSLCAVASLCGCGSAKYNTDITTIDGLEITDGTNTDVTTDPTAVEEIITALGEASLSGGRNDSTDTWQYHVRIFNRDGSVELVEMDDGHVHYDGKTYKAATTDVIGAIENALE